MPVLDHPIHFGQDSMPVVQCTSNIIKRPYCCNRKTDRMQVDNLQLPPGLSTHTASSIEFVGRAVRLLKSAPASAKLREMQDSWGSYNQQQLAQDQLAAGLGPGAGAGMPQQLLPYGDAMAYAAALRLLQDQPEYSPGALERTVEAIRADVSADCGRLFAGLLMLST